MERNAVRNSSTDIPSRSTKTRPPRSTVITRPSFTDSGRAVARGSCTSTPPCIIGAAIMKMMRSTKATSTSEVTLMSDVTGRLPRRPEPTALMPPAILEQALPGHPADQLVAEALEVALEATHPSGEMVVRHHG